MKAEKTKGGDMSKLKALLGAALALGWLATPALAEIQEKPKYGGTLEIGTVYVTIPPGSAGLRLEDPRLPLMMAAPPRRSDAPEPLRTFVTLTPEPGALLMWESWLRHEVPANGAKSARISVSFNYGWR